MQFQVPQFIEIEDTIFGPLTFKQFIYVGGGLGASYIFWRILPIYISGPLIVVVGGLAASLAFFKINGRPFIIGLENGFFFLIRHKLYLWNNARRERTAPQAAQKTTPRDTPVYVPKLSESKLHELSWSLDVKERIAQGIGNDEERELRHPQENLVTLTRTPQQIRDQMTQGSL